MSIWTHDGKTNQFDFRGERIGAGTIGGEHAVPLAFGGHTSTAVVDDQDPRIAYGRLSSVYPGGPITLTATRANAYDTNGTTTKLQDIGAAIQFTFSGSSIGVLGRINLASSAINVYIDGVLTNGRTLTYTQLDNTVYGPPGSLGPLNASDTTIYLQSSTATTNFPSSGEILIDQERITYTGKSGNHLTGVVRGASGTTAAAHSWTAIVYYMSSAASLNYGVGNVEYADGQLVWYSPFLSPGTHTIIVVVVADSGSPSNYFWFDGFIIGSILGASNISRSVGTVTLLGTTDGNGYLSLGFGQSRTSIAITGLLGYTQILPASGSGGPSTTMAKLGCEGDPTSGSPQYYIQNGSPGTLYAIQLVFAYLGESI